MSKKVKVTVLKTEVLEGKKKIKSLEMAFDPEEMACYSTVAMVKKRVMEVVSRSRLFAPDEIRDLKYDMRELLKQWRIEVRKKEEERQKKLENVE